MRFDTVPCRPIPYLLKISRVCSVLNVICVLRDAENLINVHAHGESVPVAGGCIVPLSSSIEEGGT